MLIDSKEIVFNTYNWALRGSESFSQCFNRRRCATLHPCQWIQLPLDWALRVLFIFLIFFSLSLISFSENDEGSGYCDFFVSIHSLNFLKYDHGGGIWAYICVCKKDHNMIIKCIIILTYLREIIWHYINDQRPELTALAYPTHHWKSFCGPQLVRNKSDYRLFPAFPESSQFGWGIE